MHKYPTLFTQRNPPPTVPTQSQVVLHGASVSVAGAGIGGGSLGALVNVHANFKAGSSTIIIGPPGAGTSTLLRVVAGLQRVDEPRTVLLNGVPMASAGVDMRRVAAYCGETEVHEALLTVRETLTFAATMSGLHATTAAVTAAVDATIRRFGLGEAADTIIGNSLFRGISGGQKRRVCTSLSRGSTGAQQRMDQLLTAPLPSPIPLTQRWRRCSCSTPPS